MLSLDAIVFVYLIVSFFLLKFLHSAVCFASSCAQ